MVRSAPALLCLGTLALLRPVIAQPGAHALFEAARAAFQGGGDAGAALPLLTQAAELGHVEAQSMLALAHAQGLAGLPVDRAQAVLWFRKAAQQGSADAAFNLVTLCNAKPSCLQGSTDQRVLWLEAAAAENVTEAAFQLGNALVSTDAPRALAAFLQAAIAGDGAAAFNAAHLLSLGSEGVAPQLTRALVLFERAASQSARPGLAADARNALEQLRPLWVQQADDEDDEQNASARFAAATDGGAAGEALGAEAAAAERRCVAAWDAAAAQWGLFQRLFHAHPSYENQEAVDALLGSQKLFAALLESADSCAVGGAGGADGAGGAGAVGAGGGHELRRYLILSKLVEGSKTLARDERHVLAAARWHEQLVSNGLCRSLYATRDAQRSCFNDQLACAITLRRRLNQTDEASRLLAVAHGHPHAATRWLTHAQTPRVFAPSLEARPWWTPERFGISAALAAAWAAGELQADLERLLSQRADADGAPERIVSTGAPIRGRPGDDADAAGVWSEMMLHDGQAWHEGRCALAHTLCKVLRAAPEVAGHAVDEQGTPVPPGQVTIFRLRPGAHVLPHVGVSNRRLVLQFPLRGWQGVRFRVSDEWRSYEEGRALVFDDSFEHEVYHGGESPRFVLYAALHHPGLGTPALEAGAAAAGAAAAEAQRMDGLGMDELD